ncbi:ABC-F family ATP-binding cassette domain-containing protein [Clostridium grantii]|uniref:ATP-binding cassette, subfamily F, uup n=1 Tax=Clostridium grantii DSM 8605 TaxID=1121316 RepID=A0A1M5QFC8_9CLOT|nr:ABC-F family ATP-binding cassette domain-containing protein [Clostridium grantii]SHH12546.1 ATP-binding cassette, subfamily F, uup [Clostridium grantii DSM 8605]
MNLLSIENICKSYSEKILLNEVSLGIEEGDKIGVIGVNGTGKSTFLKIIAGVEEEDAGRILKGNNVRIEYLSQNPYMDSNATVLEQIFKGNSSLMTLLREYESLLDELNFNSNNASLQNKLISLNSRMDAQNAWTVESEAKTILTQLGISDFHAKVSTLSGGQKKRIALASTLISPADLLILDEPTNHLDNQTIEWLENFLNSRKGSLLMITHDRYFLDRITNKIIELDKGNLYAYKGNYSEFLEKKSERLDLEAASENKRANLFRRELAWIRRGAKARTTKQKARIDRFEDIKAAKIDINTEKIEISSLSSRLGKKIIEIENLSKSYGDKKLLENFSYILLRDDRIGVLGPNGSGKSTLMNIISGKVPSDSGLVDIGDTVKIGYYSQENTHMDENLRVIEYVKEGAEFITVADGSKISASQMLERFLFPPTQQWTYVGSLSGGEKRRLYLLRVLMEAPNVLFLDEPTNDLDIETLTILEDYLDSFNGPVIAVSHDRYFLDRMAKKIFQYDGSSNINIFIGNYSDYSERIQILETEKEISKPLSENKSDTNNSRDKKTKPLKFSYNEKREFEEIDSIIENLELAIEEINVKIGKASSDYTKLQLLMEEKGILEDNLNEKMDRWAYLNELAEKIENGINE